VSVGIAAAAVDHLVQLARTKTPAYQTTPLRDQQLAHYLAGKAQARVAAARDTIHRAAGDAYDEAQGSLLSWDTRLRLQLAVCFAAEASADAVRLVNEVAGTSAIRLERGFERYGATHTSSHITPPSPPTATLTAGRLIFGIDNEFPFLEL